MIKAIKTYFFKQSVINHINEIIEEKSPISKQLVFIDQMSSELTNQAFKHMPEWFDGRHGNTPHKTPAAIAVMCVGMEAYKHTTNYSVMDALFSGASGAMRDVLENTHLYNFNELDKEIIAGCFNIITDLAKILQKITDDAEKTLPQS